MEKDKNLSIHPRFWDGKHGSTSHACTKPRRKRVVTDAQYKHVLEHPNDSMAKARVAKIESGRA